MRPYLMRPCNGVYSSLIKYFARKNNYTHEQLVRILWFSFYQSKPFKNEDQICTQKRTTSKLFRRNRYHFHYSKLYIIILSLPSSSAVIFLVIQVIQVIQVVQLFWYMLNNIHIRDSSNWTIRKTWRYFSMLQTFTEMFVHFIYSENCVSICVLAIKSSFA